MFDRDDHPCYHSALNKAASLNGKLKNDARQPITFQAIASVPCFELWLLLHFEDIQAALHRNEVMKRLKQHLPDYDKGAANTYSLTAKHLATAVQRAEKLATSYAAHTAPQPYTAIVELVKLLTALKD